MNHNNAKQLRRQATKFENMGMWPVLHESYRRASNFPSDGFKSTKFGMSASQLEGIGFSCEPNKKSCEKKADAKKEATESDTLFGKPADIDVKLSDDKIASINVTVGIEKKEMVELFSKALGSPKTSEHTTFLGDKIRRYYWISSGGTSIDVLINLDEKPPQGIFKMAGPLSNARYRSKQETTKMLDEINKSSVKPNVSAQLTAPYRPEVNSVMLVST